MCWLTESETSRRTEIPGRRVLACLAGADEHITDTCGQVVGGALVYVEVKASTRSRVGSESWLMLTGPVSGGQPGTGTGTGGVGVGVVVIEVVPWAANTAVWADWVVPVPSAFLAVTVSRIVFPAGRCACGTERGPTRTIRDDKARLDS